MRRLIILTVLGASLLIADRATARPRGNVYGRRAAARAGVLYGANVGGGFVGSVGPASYPLFYAPQYYGPQFYTPMYYYNIH